MSRPGLHQHCDDDSRYLSHLFACTQDQLDVGVTILTKFFRASPEAVPFFNLSNPESLDADPVVQVLGGNFVVAGAC